MNDPLADTAERHNAEPSRWTFCAAYAVPLCILPSALWRTIEVTIRGTGLEDGTAWWYPPLLSAASLGLGLLTLGLVHRWGEVVPRWIPVLGGRRIPVLTAVIPAAVGALGLIALSVQTIATWNDEPLSERPEAVWVAWTYSPMVAWGPLLLAVTWAYYRRRGRGESRWPGMPG